MTKDQPTLTMKFENGSFILKVVSEIPQELPSYSNLIDWNDRDKRCLTTGIYQFVNVPKDLKLKTYSEWIKEQIDKNDMGINLTTN